jgi:hypothetical protein
MCFTVHSNSQPWAEDIYKNVYNTETSQVLLKNKQTNICSAGINSGPDDSSTNVSPLIHTPAPHNHCMLKVLSQILSILDHVFSQVLLCPPPHELNTIMRTM